MYHLVLKCMHIQMHCVQFLDFMLLISNMVLWLSSMARHPHPCQRKNRVQVISGYLHFWFHASRCRQEPTLFVLQFGIWSLQNSNQSKGSLVFERMSILKHLEPSQCQVLEVSSSRLFSKRQKGCLAVGFSWCPKAPDSSKQTQPMVAAQWMISMLGISSGQGSPPIFRFHATFWRLWLLIWIVGVEFPVSVLIPEQECLEFKLTKPKAATTINTCTYLLLTHWLNSHPPLSTSPKTLPGKFKGWKYSKFRNVWECISVFFWGL